MSARRDRCARARIRGLVVWKVLLTLGVGIGGVYAAARLATDTPAVDNWRGATRPIESRPAAIATDPGAAAAAVTPNAPAADPFAGVDVRSDSVLRHIAGIEEKARTRPGAVPRRPAAPGTEAAARAPAAPPPPAQEVVTETRGRPVATPATPATVAAAAPADALRAGAAPTQAPALEPPPRTPVDSTSSNAGERALKGAVAVPPPAAAPPTAERTLAAARPEPVPVAPAITAPLRVASRTMPEFPGEAIRAGVRSGRVVARLSIDADGRVTATQLLSASPTGFFERESRRALSTWRYEPPGQPTTTDVELVFTRE